MKALLWRSWREYSHRAGQYQSTALLAVVYAVILGPMAVLARLGRVSLLDPRGGWTSRSTTNQSLDQLRRQF